MERPREADLRRGGGRQLSRLAAQLAYYFFLALFPALLFVVALVSFIPIANLLDTITAALARVAPGEALAIVQDQVLKIASGQNGGLLTLGMLGTSWSTSAGVTAIIDTLNQAYNIRESRPWWKVRLTAIGLTLGLRAWHDRKAAVTLKPALAAANCDIDHPLQGARPAPRRVRAPATGS